MENTSRRQFVKKSVLAALASGIAIPLFSTKTRASVNSSGTGEVNRPSEEKPNAPFQFAQVPLPYSYNALEPNIDAMTMEIHYSKHHAAYVKNINDAIAAENLAYASESEFFSNASKLSPKARNNSGGVWNHNFYWLSMKPGSAAPSGKILDAINGTFGSIDKFRELFTVAAMGRFGSGWAWLVSDKGTLKIGSTPNQDNPLMDLSEFKGTPLLTVDVWEHAYYLKYQNRRNEYLANWWNTVNWEEVSKRMV
jgi:Fe-Mn family superoxide dismutase